MTKSSTPLGVEVDTTSPSINEMASHHAPTRITRHDADLIVRALILLNGQPRFAPRDSRLHFDSYTIAAELDQLLRRTGWSWQMLSTELPRT